ncbi:MAG: 30S ribosomal protein S5 [Nanoarchaeota archaeon]|nr:30S ribosomal protein S5 [Nanoarchaeota archaeon]MBU1028294.1 30S ribosomal protein S5 [Nanoarchaeota archaeon]
MTKEIKNQGVGEKIEDKEIPRTMEKIGEKAKQSNERISEQDSETKEKPKKVESRKDMRRKSREDEEKEALAAWDPKTKLGQEVKDGKIKKIDEILDKKRKILEPEIVDSLLNVESDLISIGQSKGKFGGGKRRAWRQTQKKRKEGNIPTFSTLAVIGDGKGHIGIGTGKSKETLPARDKAIRKAKLNIMKIKRSCAGFDCDCSENHTIPFKVTGKTGSVRITLIPAAQGTGLVVGSELKKILKLAGIKDIYSRTSGRKRTTFNLVKACIGALKKTNL